MCPKLFSLPRSDALMAFAGDTLWAYPLVLQTMNDLLAFTASRERRTDIRAARAHALRVVNQLMADRPPPPGGGPDVETEFLFGGWSWESLDFRLWRFRWSAERDTYWHETIRRGEIGLVAWIGDRDFDNPARDLVGIAKAKLSALLLDRGRIGAPLDMEPFEVLVSMLRSGEYDTIGGAPQVAKVYRHMNASFLGVRWPDRDGPVTLVGRNMLGYERVEMLVLDPDDPTTPRPYGYAETAAQGQAGIDALLLPAVEELELADARALESWSTTHGYSLKRYSIRQWMRTAVARQLLVEDAGGVRLASTQRADPDVDEVR